eukprot:COSAG02_NODE_5681_length_4131_cov_3.322669_6_plen_209_part_00
MAIQEGGFRVDLAGSNAEMALGRGVYVTTTLQTALKCAESNPVAGGVLHLLIDLGWCYQVRAPGLHQKTWAQNGYDSAWAPQGVIGQSEEHCVLDPARITIKNVVLGNTAQAWRHGYEVRDRKLVCEQRNVLPPGTLQSMPMVQLKHMAQQQGSTTTNSAKGKHNHKLAPDRNTLTGLVCTRTRPINPPREYWKAKECADALKNQLCA